MAKLTVSIRDALWKEFSQVAILRRKNPQRLAERLLAEAMKRMADEDLLGRTERAFRRSKVKLKDVEALVRRHRIDTASRGHGNA
jgi:hypothetical protein